MKNIFLGILFFLTVMGTGCSTDAVEPELIIEPPFEERISHDTLTSGNHLGIAINTTAEQAYMALQNFKNTQGLEYVNVTGEGASNMAQIGNRIPLYQSIFLDEKKGTDSGIQISFEAGKVKSIYLNSGKSLDQWPAKENASSSVRIGDKVEDLQAKLLKIESKSAYTHKFERISMFIKILGAAYDNVMTSSPQWYFRYEVEPKVYELVQIHFDHGRVKFIEVSRFKVPS